VTVTIGGNPAQVLFAGLAPGYAGLYQVNVVVPEGVTPGANVPAILTTAAFSSPPVTVAVQ
jgi:adhesin/invasin